MNSTLTNGELRSSQTADLGNVYHTSMIRGAYARRIIHSPINLVQYIKDNSTSYAILLIATTVSLSYIHWQDVIAEVGIGLTMYDIITLLMVSTGGLPVLLGSSIQSGFDDFGEDDSPRQESPSQDGASTAIGEDDEEDEDDDDADDAENTQVGNDDGDPPGSGTCSSDSSDDPDDVGAGYARVSKDEQKEHSIPTQLNNIEKAANREGILLPFEPIVDEGKTGQNFDRPGILEVFDLAKEGKITHLLVDELSRIGRNAPETLYFIFLLEEEYGVTIVTKDGSKQMDEINDLMEMTLSSLISHISAKTRGRRALETKIRRFIDERNWKSWFRNIPLGYRETDDGWIEPYFDEIDLAKQMFKDFLEGKSYGAISEEINSIADERDLDKSVSPSLVKRSLQRPVYIGRPTILSESRELDDDERFVEDSDLQIIDHDTFEDVQKAIEERTRKGGKKDDSVDPDTLSESFHPLIVFNHTSDIDVNCPDCQETMVANGNRSLFDGTVKNLLCPACGRQRKFPKRKELIKMVECVMDLMDKFNIPLDREDD